MGKKGYFVLFGTPGGGKSYEAAETFQNSFSFLSAPNNQLFYEQTLPRPGKGPARRTVVLDRYALYDSAVPGPPKIVLGTDGLPTVLPQKTLFDNIIGQVTRRIITEGAQGLPLTYSNVIIDEAGAFWFRVFREMAATSVNSSGKLDMLKAYTALETWSTEVIDLLRQVTQFGANVCIIAHDRDPDIGADKLGGPKFPSQAVMKQLCADADGVLLRQMEDQKTVLDLSGSVDPTVLAAQMAATAKPQVAQRYWRAHASQHWMSKLRGLPDSAFEEIRGLPLERIITMAGFTP